eukprot:scaffold150989_cov23-Tisochrysis_lutea.AAC.2
MPPYDNRGGYVARDRAAMPPPPPPPPRRAALQVRLDTVCVCPSRWPLFASSHHPPEIPIPCIFLVCCCVLLFCCNRFIRLGDPVLVPSREVQNCCQRLADHEVALPRGLQARLCVLSRWHPTPPCT